MARSGNVLRRDYGAQSYLRARRGYQNTLFLSIKPSELPAPSSVLMTPKGKALSSASSGRGGCCGVRKPGFGLGVRMARIRRGEVAFSPGGNLLVPKM
jgi:hypothetical protein